MKKKEMSLSGQEECRSSSLLRGKDMFFLNRKGIYKLKVTP